MATVCMKYKWTKERFDQLIALIEERPCLYNTKKKECFNKEKRYTLDDIATA